MAMTNLNLKVPQEVLDRIEAEAARSGSSRSDHVRDILVAYLSGDTIPQLRREIVVLRDAVEAQRRSHEQVAQAMRSAADLQTKSLMFALETVIINLPNGGQKAADLFRARYTQELLKG